MQGGSKLRLQGYLDHSRREDRFTYSPSYSIADIEAQHSLVLGAHQLDWAVAGATRETASGPGCCSVSYRIGRPSAGSTCSLMTI